MLYARVSLSGIIVGKAVIFEEPNPVTFLIVENIGGNRVREVVNRMRLHTNCEVHYLCLRRLRDVVDNVTFFYRDNPDSVSARWIEDKWRKVGRILRNWKRSHIRTS